MKHAELMTLQEVAKYLRLNKITVYRLAHKKKIPAFKVGGQWRFSKERISKWLEGHENLRMK